MTARTIRLAAILVIMSVSTFITAVILYDFISVSSNFILVWQNYIFQPPPPPPPLLLKGNEYKITNASPKEDLM